MSHTELFAQKCAQCGGVFATDGDSELCLECRDEAMSRIQADILAAGGIPHPVFAAVPPDVVIKRICAECHHAFDPHVYPSATCYPCDEKLANRGQADKARKARWVEAHRPQGRAGGSPKLDKPTCPVARRMEKEDAMERKYVAQWGHSSPELDALHAMDKRVDKLQDGLTNALEHLRTERKALTARAEQAEQHPEIVAANTMAAEMEASRLFAAEQVEHERQVRRRELEEAVQVVVYLVALLAATLGIALAYGLAAALTTFAVLAVIGFLTWRERRQITDRREDAMATLARNRAR